MLQTQGMFWHAIYCLVVLSEMITDKLRIHKSVLRLHPPAAFVGRLCHGIAIRQSYFNFKNTYKYCHKMPSVPLGIIFSQGHPTILLHILLLPLVVTVVLVL